MSTQFDLDVAQTYKSHAGLIVITFAISRLFRTHHKPDQLSFEVKTAELMSRPSAPDLLSV